MPHNGGTTQLNFGLQYIDGLINQMHTGGPLAISGGLDYDPSKHDANGYLKTAYAGSNGPYTQINLPDQTDRPGNYIVKWTSTGAGVQIIIGGSYTLVSGSLSGANGRAVIAPIDTTLVIHQRVTTHAFTKIGIVHADDEADYDAGEYWQQSLVDELIAAKIGDLRFMNDTRNNTSNIVTWAQRASLTHWNWKTSEITETRYGVAAKGAGDDYTATITGFTLVDKAYALVRYDTNSAGTTPTLDINGTGVKTLKMYTGAELYEGRKPLAGKIAHVIYDADLDAYLTYGGNSVQNNLGLVAGIPVEACFNLAMRVGAHVRFCVPMFAVDPMSDYTTELSTYAKAYIAANAPWMIFKIAGPNECWNSIFNVTHYAAAKEIVHGGGASQWDEWYGRAISKIGQAVNAVFGGNPKTQTAYWVMCECWTLNTSSTERFNSSRYVSETDASKKADLWITHAAIHGYWQSGYYGTATELTMATEWATATTARKLELTEQYVLYTGGAGALTLPNLYALWDAWVVTCAAHNVGLTQYEGGVSFDTQGNSTRDNFTYAARRSPSVHWLTHQSYSTFAAKGGVFPSAFDFSSSSTADVWAMHYPSMYNADASPQWQAISDWNAGKRRYRLTAS